MQFTHLHTHTTYSLLDGLPQIPDLIKYTKELGMDSIAITDHGVMYGTIEFYKAAKAAGIKPIIGQEFYFAERSLNQKEKGFDDRRYHLILLAKDNEGYKNLITLSTIAQIDGFYYKPRIDFETLQKYSRGLICSTACLQGKIPQLLLVRRFNDAKKEVEKMVSLFGKENFYLELQAHKTIAEQDTVNKGLIELARQLNVGIVATQDSHYLRKGDAEAQDVLMLINTNAKKTDPERLSMAGEDFSLRSPQEMIELFKDTPQAIENTQKIAAMCNVELQLGKSKLPKFPLPEGVSDVKYLRDLCEKNLAIKYESVPEAKERMEYELSVIEKMGFSSYFLIVQDFINFAKNNGIVVGPGRGSAAGSLVAYLLNITNIDPLRYNLLFERFLNPERISMPDIDSDFTDTRRDEVLKYVSEKYGRDHVAQIITFGTMAARQVIRDVGRVLDYPYSVCDELAKLIPMNTTLHQALDTIDEFKEKYKDKKVKRLIDLAKQLEGVTRHASTHACGVVISPEPLTNVTPLQHPPQDEDSVITQYEMHAIEDLGLLKMDFLGLKNLTILENTRNLVEKLHNIKIDFSKLPLDDETTYKNIFQKADTTGVFQLESDGMKRYLKELKPTNIEDIIAMVALYRPGPMELIPDYIARKNGRQPIKYLNPKLAPILDNTFGVIIYQEQVMKIAQALASYTLGEADVLRKAVGKKIKDLLEEQEKKMVTGMVKNGMSEEKAREVWNWILPFARYGFNRSHSCAYGIVAYETAFMKAHYPVEFMAGLMNVEQKNLDRLKILLSECRRMGIKVLPPDVNESFKDFTVILPDKIRFGLGAVKNAGEDAISKIISERKANGKFTSLENFVSRADEKALNKKNFESLIKAGAFDSLAPREKLLYNLEYLLEISKDIKKRNSFGEQSLFGGQMFGPMINLKEPTRQIPQLQMLTYEKELLGVFVSKNPLENYKDVLKNILPISSITPRMANQMVTTCGIITNIHKILTKNGKAMLFVLIEDTQSAIEFLAFQESIDQNPFLFQENKIVKITGKVSTKDGALKLVFDKGELLDDDVLAEK